MITGYAGKMGFKTGKLIVNNVVTGLREMHLIDIQPDGVFSVNFPLTGNQECWVAFPFFNSPVYFEAGKKLVQDFNIADIPKVSSVFTGNGAAINNDINKVRPILMEYNWDAMYADIYGLTPEQYKAYFLRLQDHKLALIDSVAKTAGMSKTAYDLAWRSVKYEVASTLIYYNSTRESAHRRKNKLSFNDRTPVLTPIKLKADYFDFLKKLKYNDPFALVSYNYYLFINRLMFMDLVSDKVNAGTIEGYRKQINVLKTKDTLNEAVKATIKMYEGWIRNNATVPGAWEKARPIVLQSLLHTDISLELDLMNLQPVSNQMDMGKDTLSTVGLDSIRSKIKNKFLLADVVALNNRIKQSIQNATIQTGYNYNQTPANAPADSFFTKILDKYKGKVVFIDFWATWCGPCMQGIQEIAPLKEELAQNKDIVFLYVTNYTSPEKTYLTVMPGIKGEHYRVSDDQYNFLSSLFHIHGIPHYTIINKQGAVVDEKFQWSEIGQIKKRLNTLVNEPAM
jgi:thiol-disulfide isomerase/thioredoxin